ncbi:MAG: FAD:protein FMN transferase [Flavobacteriaceae bacterium]
MKPIFFLTLFLFSVIINSQERFKKTIKLMGSRFDISVVANTEEEGYYYIDLAVSEIDRIEKLVSSWDPNSQTSEINRNAGIKPVKVDKELFDLIERSIAISKLTDGAFDISYASLDKVWKFDGSMNSMPPKDEIVNSVSKVGFENIVLNRNDTTVYLKLKGMKIGFGGIAKGYAADKAKKLLKDKGVVAGIINASGDMNTWGNQPNGDEWKVGIKNPMNKNKVFALMPVSNSAVVTSGNYEKFVEFSGKRYSHIINPKTGYPSSGIISVSVFAPKAELADALATSIFVMGLDVGLDFVNQLRNIDCIVVDDKGKIHSSEGIEIKNN